MTITYNLHGVTSCVDRLKDLREAKADIELEIEGLTDFFKNNKLTKIKGIFPHLSLLHVYFGYKWFSKDDINDPQVCAIKSLNVILNKAVKEGILSCKNLKTDKRRTQYKFNKVFYKRVE